MKEKGIALLWHILFLGIILLIPISYLAAGDSRGNANTENRTLTEKPQFRLSALEDFPESYEAYYNDSFPLRSQMIRANSRIDYDLLGESSSDDVIVGKDGWLFFQGEEKNALTQYKGMKPYSQEQLRRIGDNLTATPQSLADRGIVFVLFIAPNKERVYADYMPGYILRDEAVDNVEQVVSYLREHTDIPVIWCEEALREARQEYPETDFYYRLDTHWNHAGAYIGAKILLEQFGIRLPPLSHCSLKPNNLSNYDLAKFLNLQEELADTEIDYEISGYPSGNLNIEKEDFYTEYIYHSSGADPRKLFMIRDSFAANMAHYVAAQFNESYMVHQSAFSKELLEQQQPELLVYETVERYLDTLLNFRVD